MSELHTVITLQELHIESLIYPHEDLPDGMKMSAQLIIDQYIWLHTRLVKSEPSGKSWKLRVGCNIPAQPAMFQVVFLRHSEMDGTRLLGHAALQRDNIVKLARSKTSFECLLNTVNSDGPTLRLGAGFAISQTSCHHPSISAFIALPDSKIASVASDIMANDLQQAYENSNIKQFTTNSLNIWLMHERILLGCQESKERAQLLNILGDMGMKKYNSVASIQDLSQTICAYADAVRDNSIYPENSWSPVFFTNLGLALLRRGGESGREEDITKAIKMLQQGVNLTPDGHPQQRSRTHNLGAALLKRSEQVGDLGDLNQVITYLRGALDLTPDGHMDRPSTLSNLGVAFHSRFKQVGDLGDLNQAITYHHTAIDLTPDGHIEKPSWLNNFGVALYTRFEQLGDLADLNQAITYYQAAIDLTPDGHMGEPSRLTNLGFALCTRFDQLGHLPDLNQAITYHHAALVLTPDGHMDKRSVLNNFGAALHTRFEQVEDLADLNQAITYYQAALDLTPDGHMDKPSRIKNIGAALHTRFDRLGDIVDLNQAITYYQAAVDLTPDGHMDKPSRLNTHGAALRTRFDQLGDLADLNQAITYHHAALDLTPDGHMDKHSRLSNLGVALHTRFDQLGDLVDLNQAITYYQAALDLTPDGHMDKPSQLNTLGAAFRTRFDQLGHLPDLNQAITYHHAALDLTPDGHMDKRSMLNNLGIAHNSRFQQLGNLPDLNHSITYNSAAVDLTPDGHPNKPVWLINLGSAFVFRYASLKTPEDFQKGLHCYALAACSPSGPISVRFRAARIWSMCAHESNSASVLKAYATAISLLPELAWLALSISDRHHRLFHAGQLVRDAAAAAIAAGDPQKAVEWLEQGRSIIWGQFLGLRTPVDDLKQKHPRLAEQFLSVSKTLEGAGTKMSSINESITPQRDFHDLALQRNNILNQIRQQPGFEQFLLPKSLSYLSCTAQSGPVVILNINHEGEVVHVPLPSFTSSHAEELAERLATALGATGRAESLHGEADYVPPRSSTIFHVEDIDDLLESTLGTTMQLWTKIIQPILNAIAINSPTHHPGRIWWCPTGSLAFLPIHAAGLYGEGQQVGSKLSDYVISSYTPSLSALLECHHMRSVPQTELQLLAVSQASANGQTYIPGAHKEAEYIQQEAHGKLHVLHLDESNATLDNVQEGMKVSSWAHFACHGVQHPTPTESALLLAGSSRLTLSNIIKLQLPNADLAFLSACETATGSRKLQDEAVHLTAGMLLAGYHSVIGTMWTIQDDDAPQVARDVYAHLLKASPPDSKQAAEALHLAVQKLQKEGKSFLYWVPFVHFGV
ncbi:CHAT domain-containing protein [Favolaschia claudopus]|uniref:CHAT domain-containing protein n=1 Tax=Favolaschia claudopus TaxID=2862362 RepID=A0AAV9Z8M1_9AGAR